MGVIVLFKKSLPENAQIPSVYGFAECQTTGTRQRRALPSARPRALGKHVAHGMPTLCRVLAVGKERHSAYRAFVECRKASTRQRQVTCPARAPAVRVPDGRYPLPSAAKRKLHRVSVFGTRQSLFRRVPSSWHSANSFYFYFSFVQNFYNQLKFENLIPSSIWYFHSLVTVFCYFFMFAGNIFWSYF